MISQRNPTYDSDDDPDVKRDDAQAASKAKPRVRGQKVQIDFTPNLNKVGRRGRRGKVYTGISDLQADFEADRLDRAGVRIKSLAAHDRALAKKKNSRGTSRKVRGFRGKRSTKDLDDDVGVVGRHASKMFARGNKLDRKRSESFRIEKARKARLKAGREFKRKKPTEKTLEARYDLCEMVARFKRTGKLPHYSVRLEDIEASDQSHVNKYQLREMIDAFLLRSGIKPNPGPDPKDAVPTALVLPAALKVETMGTKIQVYEEEPHVPKTSWFSWGVNLSGAAISKAVNVSRKVASQGRVLALKSASASLKVVIPKMQKIKSVVEQKLLKSGDVQQNPGPRDRRGRKQRSGPPTWAPKFKGAIPDSSPTSSSTDRQDRDKEKIDACGGNTPGDRERLERKRQKGQKNFKTDSLLHQAEMIDDDKRKAEQDAERQMQIDLDAEEEDTATRVYDTLRDPFVMRSGGFARPWFPGFGNPESKGQLFVAILSFVVHLYKVFRGKTVHDLWYPRDGVRWKAYRGLDDGDRFTPVFKGCVSVAVYFILYFAIATLVYFLINTIIYLLFWVNGMGAYFEFAALCCTYFVQSSVVIFLFASLFRPLARYAHGDIMREYGQTHLIDEEPFVSRMRMTGNRYRKATDPPVLHDVFCRTVTYEDHSAWYTRYWATSWLFGSMFSWIDMNRLTKLIVHDERVIVSLTAVDMLMNCFVRSNLETFQEAVSKARNFMSTYDELKMGTHTVDGRVVREDTIQYAASLYWSRIAADASVGKTDAPLSA